jgi:4-hydroxy-tetrahydrodipicolinate synthase
MNDALRDPDTINGLWVALATPIGPDGTIAQAALARHATSLLAAGCDGVVLFGTTGEGPSFSSPERLAAVEALLKSGIAPGRIALGAGFPAVPETVALLRSALALSLTHALLLPPYFFRDADEPGIEAGLAAMLDGTNDPRLRATLYNIPQVSGVAIPPGVATRLAASHKGVVTGLKDSTGDFASFRAFRAAAPGLAITVGNEPDIARALAEGGAGTICGLANVAPHLVRGMFTEPSLETAVRQALALIRGPFIPWLKSILAARTGDDAWRRLRPPFTPLHHAEGVRLAASLDAIARPAAA